MVASLVAIFYSIRALAPFILSSLSRSIVYFIDYAAAAEIVTPSDLSSVFVQSCITFAMTALPLLLICGLVAILVTGAQTKMLFTAQAAVFKFSRLNPIEGIKRIFSIRSIVELTKSIIKISVLGYIIYLTLIKEVSKLPRLMDMTTLQAMGYTGNVILSMVQSAAIVMVFLAGADYFYQWWDYEKKLRMSKQEIKEEYKQTEGDPQIKGKIRQRQQEQARRRMMQQVPTADVVIRNPTHFAVAIKYDPHKNIAPIVVAKGADAVALRIVKVAEEHKVTVTENIPLARGLYEAVDLNGIIPERFYQPVAEVLAFVYSLQKKDINYETIQ